VGLGWHLVEAAIAIAAGLAASSIALIGFGADSVIEGMAAVILLWRFGEVRAPQQWAEHRAHRLIGVSFYVIAAYVAVEAARTLATGSEPEASTIGIALAAFTLVTMPLLAAAKRRVGEQLGSVATTSEARQTSLCAYLSGALLVGLSANALFGAWWADPIAALVIAAVAAQEGRRAWAGDPDTCCA
jgi:divalent metal cation (Fe/Co/Zn/Cd) transporter